MPLPDALKAIPRFINWHLDEHGSKVPCGTRGRNLKGWQQPRAWLPFEKAAHLATQHGFGLGFVLNGDGVGMADLDSCVHDDGSISPWAQRWVDDFDFVR